MSRIVFAASLSALLLSAPFLFPLLLPLAWIAFVPLFWIVNQAENLRRAVFYGWLAGGLTHLVGFHWLVYTISVFGGFPYSVSAVIYGVYAALQGMQMALFALLVRRFGLGPLKVFPALFWVAIEFWFPLLFPWYLANSQSYFGSFIQTADLVGPYGASAIVMWSNAVLYDLVLSWRQNQRVSWRAAGLVGLLVVGSVVYGLVRLDQLAARMATAPKLSAAAIQGNIDVDLKWNPTKVKHNLETYQSLTRQSDGVRLAIWPESAIEEWLPENLQQLPKDFMASLELKGAYFIFGARSFRGNPAGPDRKAFNSAFLTDARGLVLGHYHKQILLAFGEYLPFATILSKLPPMPFAEGFTPGDGPHTLDLSGGIRIAPLICYEDLMPGLSRSFISQTKANILVNLTNDAWYGRSVAPWQHARLAQWRAIETRRSLLRVTNTGVTSLINARGEIQESLPVFTPTVLKAQVEVLEDETLYVRFGDWFAWGMTLLSLGIVLFYLKKASRHG